MRIANILILIQLFTAFSCDQFGATEPKNTLPVIDRIIVDSDSPMINQIIKLTSIASDADKQQLYFRWSVSEGALSNEGIGNPIYWSTPNIAGNVRIVSMVYDGIDMVTKSIGVDVSDGLEQIE